MGIRNGSIVILVFLLLVVVVPDSVLGSRTSLLAEPEALVVSQSGSTSVGTGSDFHSVRKLMEQRRRPTEAAATGIHPPPVDDQVSKSVPSAPAARQSRFALLFRRLAKGTPTPTLGRLHQVTIEGACKSSNPRFEISSPAACTGRMHQPIKKLDFTDTKLSRWRTQGEVCDMDCVFPLKIPFGVRTRLQPLLAGSMNLKRIRFFQHLRSI